MSSSIDDTSGRIQSVDFVRGLVMVLMAIDHVRVYSGLPAGGPEPGIFFTRWVTHFCAPAFVFLSGTSAFLYGTKLGDLRKLSRYLLSRGIILIILELTIIRFFWTFNLNLSEFVLAGVIWMLGWCMVILSFLVSINAKSIGIVGLTIIFFQGVFGMFPQLLPESVQPSFGLFWEFIYSSGYEAPPGIIILYVIVPWIGVMMAGYGFGIILQLDEIRRDKLLIRIGLCSTILFLIAGTYFALTDVSENSPSFIYRLLGQRKYPASQLFLLMTLGPAILIMPFTEHLKGAIAKAIILFGKVPFFYYLLHILIIHLSALVVQVIVSGETHTQWYATAPYTWMEEANRWSLGLLYLVFAVDVVILYFICRWYARYKFNHPEIGWLKYL